MKSQSLIAFAADRAANAGLVAALLNALVVYFSVSDLPAVPTFALFPEHREHSLIGTLVPLAVLISLLVTLVTVRATVKSREAGEVYPPIDGSVPWFARTLKVVLFRAVIGLLLVMVIALALWFALPTYSAITPTLVVLVVALFAGAMASLMSYAAILETVPYPKSDEKNGAASLRVPYEKESRLKY